MKILCQYSDGGSSYVRSGWGRCLKACSHNFLFWNPATKPAFDVFSEFEPDLLISCSYDLDRAVAKCIAARPHMKVAMFASAWGPYLKDIDLKQYPIVVVSEQEKRAIGELKRLTGKPDFVFIHTHGHWLEGTMSGWAEIGVPYLGVLNAADTFVNLNAKPKGELKCDFCFVGGRWGYKARNIDRFLLPLCHPSKNLTGKIFSRSEWPVHQHLGTIDDLDAASLFASATVCPNVSEPHSTDDGKGWDLVERPYKVLAAGGMCVSDYVEEGRALFAEDELPMARTPEEFEHLIRHYIANPVEREAVRKRGQEKVLREHTYWERVSQLLTGLGLTDETELVASTKKRYLGP